MSEDLQQRLADARPRVHKLASNLSSDTMPTLRASHDGQLQAERELAAGHQRSRRVMKSRLRTAPEPPICPLPADPSFGLACVQIWVFGTEGNMNARACMLL